VISRSEGKRTSPGVSTAELKSIASRLRLRAIQMSHRAGTPHLGSALSCMDILATAYWRILNIDVAKPDDENRDRFILSKGHAASALYAALAERGFFPAALLDTFGEYDSPLAEQPAPGCAPGVELATGSLGHGLPVGVGMALAAKIKGQRYRVIVTMSDGECNEGSVWEAAMFAPRHGLEDLMVLIDYNKWQATGRSNEVMQLESLAAKWTAFGWSTYEVDGHDVDALTAHMANSPDGSGKPIAIIAHTVKGKGVSFMEDDNNWHYKVPSAEEVEKSRVELGVA